MRTFVFFFIYYVTNSLNRLGCVVCRRWYFIDRYITVGISDLAGSNGAETGLSESGTIKFKKTGVYQMELREKRLPLLSCGCS